MTAQDPYANYHQPSLELAWSFDLERGGFKRLEDARLAQTFLEFYGISTELDEGGGVFRVHVPALGEDFSPGSHEPCSWVDSAQYLQS